MSPDNYDTDRTYSVLFATPGDRASGERSQAPEFFSDLNCDQIVDTITAGRADYNLTPFFYGHLSRVEAIDYRHQVMQDLDENAPLHESVVSFADHIRDVRNQVARAGKMYYKEQNESCFLDAVDNYCKAIEQFEADLGVANVRSRGLFEFRRYLHAYAISSRFRDLLTATKQLKADLATVEYCVLVKGSGFAVRRYEREANYSREVERTFEKFKQGAAKDYRVKFSTTVEMNHIEAKILEFVAKLYPDIFGALHQFCATNRKFIDETVVTFEREIQVYLAYLAYMAPLRRRGLPFSYPRVSCTTTGVNVRDGFDVALAYKLLAQNALVVCNDFQVEGHERIMVVSGPNQGGKTTFARSFGQLHYLAGLGCPVPGREAQLLLFDQIFTHFEKEERVENLRGKLEDDLLRIRSILDQVTSRSVLILNEVFTSTSVQDETFLSERVMERIIEIGALGVWVTFLDELASFGREVVSMVSTVEPENPALRTFKILRRPADGLAYAMAIAQKYELTYNSIMRRIGS